VRLWLIRGRFRAIEHYPSTLTCLAPAEKIVDNVPRRYADQFQKAEDALRKMEESIRAAREFLDAAKKIVVEVNRDNPPKPKPPDAIT